ncbi:MAG: hypothetical protein M5R40_06730 [Anaerolineae bacterium]|nr:hypothetical protein [Anaerolineae bacterium]
MRIVISNKSWGALFVFVIQQAHPPSTGFDEPSQYFSTPAGDRQIMLPDCQSDVPADMRRAGRKQVRPFADPHRWDKLLPMAPRLAVSQPYALPAMHHSLALWQRERQRDDRRLSSDNQ